MRTILNVSGTFIQKQITAIRRPLWIIFHLIAETTFNLYFKVYSNDAKELQSN